MEPTRPASLEQVRRARNGRFVHVGGEVERALRDYDPNLRLRYSEAGGYYVVYHLDPVTGDEDLVTTALDYDMRIVARVIAIDSERYDLVAEMELMDGRAEREAEHRVSEHIGEVGERLHHAIRKDLGDTGRAFFKGA